MKRCYCLSFQWESKVKAEKKPEWEFSSLTSSPQADFQNGVFCRLR